MGLGALQIAAGVLDLGGGDQIHGIGDLPGILNAFDPALDISCTCHGITFPYIL